MSPKKDKIFLAGHNGLVGSAVLRRLKKLNYKNVIVLSDIEDYKNYISHYHPNKYLDRYRGGFKNFKNYKRAVFANPGKPQIEISNLSILRSKNYAVATFKQSYISAKIKDTGKKILYLEQDDQYKWKIVNEQLLKEAKVDIKNQIINWDKSNPAQSNILKPTPYKF